MTKTQAIIKARNESLRTGKTIYVVYDEDTQSFEAVTKEILEDWYITQEPECAIDM